MLIFLLYEIKKLLIHSFELDTFSIPLILSNYGYSKEKMRLGRIELVGMIFGEFLPLEESRMRGIVQSRDQSHFLLLTLDPSGFTLTIILVKHDILERSLFDPESSSMWIQWRV